MLFYQICIQQRPSWPVWAAPSTAQCECGVFDENGHVAMTKGLDFLQGATLTCAGSTAWNALYVLKGNELRAEDVDLTQWTAGVSVCAVRTSSGHNFRFRSLLLSIFAPSLLGFFLYDHLMSSNSTIWQRCCCHCTQQLMVRSEGGNVLKARTVTRWGSSSPRGGLDGSGFAAVTCRCIYIYKVVGHFILMHWNVCHEALLKLKHKWPLLPCIF